jgi:hypothetical protein
MEASQHSLLAACFTLNSINATVAIVPWTVDFFSLLHIEANHSVCKILHRMPEKYVEEMSPDTRILKEI